MNTNYETTVNENVIPAEAVETASTETTNNSNMERVFSLWEATSKKGNKYYNGHLEDKSGKVVAFLKEKKSLVDPDLVANIKNGAGEICKTINLYCKTSSKGKKFLSGSIDGREIIGFFNEDPKPKQPAMNFFYVKERE